MTQTLSAYLCPKVTSLFFYPAAATPSMYEQQQDNRFTILQRLLKGAQQSLKSVHVGAHYCLSVLIKKAFYVHCVCTPLLEKENTQKSSTFKKSKNKKQTNLLYTCSYRSMP